MDVSVRASFPEEGNYEWDIFIRKLEAVGNVEVAFRHPRLFLINVEVDRVLSPLNQYHVKAKTIHMAHAKITDRSEFLATFHKTLKLAKSMNCRNMVIHPSRTTMDEDIDNFITYALDPVLEEEKACILWETFSGSKRFLNGIEDIAAFCWKRKNHFACYDFSHIYGTQVDVEGHIDKFSDQIRCFHVSNRNSHRQHLPIFSKEGDLDFQRIVELLKTKAFDGILNLEYLPQFHDRLVRDALSLREMVEQPH